MDREIHEIVQTVLLLIEPSLIEDRLRCIYIA